MVGNGVVVAGRQRSRQPNQISGVLTEHSSGAARPAAAAAAAVHRLPQSSPPRSHHSEHPGQQRRHQVGHCTAAACPAQHGSINKRTEFYQGLCVLCFMEKSFMITFSILKRSRDVSRVFHSQCFSKPGQPGDICLCGGYHTAVLWKTSKRSENYCSAAVVDRTGVSQLRVLSSD